MKAYGEVFSLLRQNAGLVALMLALLIAGTLGGLASYPVLEDDIPAIVEKAFSGIIIEDSKLETVLNIISRNLRVAFLSILLGVTVIAPLLIISLNGFFAGLVLRYSLARDVPVTKMVYGVAPHAVPELAAFIVAGAFGLRIGIALFSGNAGLAKRNMTDAVKIYLLVVVPLLALSGILETYVSAVLIS